MNIYRFYKESYRDSKYRVKGKRNISKDILLYGINKLVRPFDLYLVNQYYSEDFPIIFIVSTPRAGSTFVYQFIVKNFDVGFINNYVSRFWICPLVGIKLSQKKLKNKNKIKYESSFGHTKGLNSPHEFGYFWQYWMDHHSFDELTDKELERIDWKAIRRELMSISGYFEKPLVLKNLAYTNYKIKKINCEIPNSFFIYLVRNPVFTIQSIYESRIKIYGSPETWWSTKPRKYQSYKKFRPVEQIAKQVVNCKTHIESALKFIEDDRKIILKYEDITKNPKQTIKRLGDLFGDKVGQRESYVDNIKNSNKKSRMDWSLSSRI